MRTRFIVAIFASMLIAGFFNIGLQFGDVIAQTPTPLAEEESVDGGNGTRYDQEQVPLPNQPPSAILGQPIYMENCAPCHGQTGASDGPVVEDLPNPPPLFSDFGTIQTKSPAEYFHTTKFGRIENLMPPWGNRLNDEQIWHAAAFAWSLHTNQEMVEAGRTTIEKLAVEDPSILSAIESTFSTRSTHFLTQQALTDELVDTYPTAFSQLSGTELINVVDYIRTLTVIPPWGATYRAGSGIITGAVQFAPDDLPPMASLADLPVTLDAFIHFDKVATFETTTDSDGNFRFTGLSDSANVIYLLQATYLGVTYGSEAFDIAGSSADNSKGDAVTASTTIADITVYGTTEGTDSLVYERVNWVVDYAPGEVIIGQILSLRNEGERSIVGRQLEGADNFVTVELPLPVDAYAIQFQDGLLGERYIQVGNDVFDTEPVTPGEPVHQVFMSYRLPVDGNRLSVEQIFRYPVRLLNLLVADIPNLEATVSDLIYVGEESIQNIPYRYWQGQDLNEQSFRLELAGLISEGEADPRGERADDSSAVGAAPGNGLAVNMPPRAVSTIPVMEPIIPVMVGSVIFFLLVGLSIGPLTRMRKSQYNERLTQTRERLLREIAQMDSSYNRGEIGEEAWHHSRSTLKEELLSVSRQLQSSDAGE